ADAVARDLRIPVSRRRPRGRVLVQRKSLIAFLFALPLITIVTCLVIYPAFYSMHLATLNKSMTKFVGFGNFEFLFRRNTFWMVVEQSVLFAVTAVIFKALIGFIVVNVWVGSPFFMIMYLAALKSVPEQLHEAAAIDGANWFQKIWYVNLPMMRNIIQITALFSLIVTFANFDIVKVLTNGGPVDQTHVFATWAFTLGIWGNDIPLGASVSLFMFPILAVAAALILRNIRKRGNEA